MVLPYDIEVRNDIGEGSTARVSQVVRDGRMVAVKTFKCSLLTHRLAATREIAILSLTKHENLIKLLSVDEFNGMPRLCMEFCSGGNLFTLVHLSDAELQWGHKVKFLGDIAEGMQHLHGHQPMIMHRDLKSLNILLPSVYLRDQLPCVKISDLGSCRMQDRIGDSSWSSLTKCVGTSPWMAPEVSSGMYDHTADVYSFGMVMFEVLAQEFPFEGEETDALPELALRGLRPDLDAISPSVSEAVIELLCGTWLQKAVERPSFTEALRVLATCSAV